MKKLNVNLFFVIFFCIIISSFAFAQMQKLEGPNLHTQSDIFITDKGARYSDLITLNFNKQIITNNVNPINIDINSFFEQNVKDYFSLLKEHYGNFKIVKCFPQKKWGDTIAINKRTFKKVKIKDRSQIVQLKFNNLVPFDSIVNNLRRQSFIEHAQGPEIIKLCVAPDDPLYSSGPHWAFDKINAETAWDITKGSDTMTISINDVFDNGTLHDDLVGKVDYVQYGTQGHGGAVAGIAGANTNNNLGVASLGWNSRLMLHNWGYWGIVDAIDRGADIINFSWRIDQDDNAYIRNAIHDALNLGIICVAAAGNEAPTNVNYIPSVQYPAAYNFGTDGQVIAVSATQWNGTNETFVDGWNYSPGTDPINDPTNSFIDISAPGKNIEIILGENSYSPNGQGTSDAAPFVSALCGLILSINSTLTPNQVFDIITNSADKIGQYSYNGNGWNRYMGHGRINAYSALKYTLEQYGGTLTQNLTIPAGETWSFNSGVTVTFLNGSSLTVNGTLNAVNNQTFKFSTGSSLNVNGSLNSENSTFTSTSTSTYWNGIKFNSGSSGSLNACEINNVQAYGGYAISINGSSPTIQNSTIENNVIACGGISITNSNTPYLYNNIIQNNSYHGIYIYNSNVYLRFNTISASSSYAAIYCDYFSTPLFAAPGGGYEEGRNTLQNGYYGLAGYYYSNINAGTSSIAYNNRFINNSYANVYASYYTTIYARYNWWGQPTANKYYAVSGSVIYADHPLPTDPGGGMLMSASPNNSESDKLNIVSSTSNAVNNPSSDLRRNLADMIDKFRKTKDKSIINFVKQYVDDKSDPDDVRSLAMEVLANVLVIDNNLKEAIALNEQIISDYPNTIQEKNGLMNLFYINYNSGDYSKAEKILSVINKDYSEAPDVKLAHWLVNSVNSKVNNFSLYKAQSEIKDNVASELTPSEYKLLQNYPNPFNPTSIIQYQIQKAGLVTLRVYDILGREVKTLVNRQQAPGSYSVEFNAENLPSGIYFYRISANGFFDVKKMILMK